MPNACKITPDMVPELLAQAGAGKSLAQLSAWVQKTYGVSVGPTAIRKHLNKHRKEREVVAKAVVREKIAKTVTSDLDALNRELRRARMMATRLYRASKGRELDTVSETGSRTPCDVYFAAVEAIRKIVETKLHFSGADAPDDSAAELLAAEQSLAGRMAGIAARLRESGVLPKPDAGGTGGAQ